MTGLTAWVFPGQGAQEPGMGRDVYDASPAARRCFDRADEILGRPISRLCFEGSADELGDTANSQPAMYVTSLAYLAAARERDDLGDDAAFVAGHSLGEYTALCAADGLEFEAGLRLVETRGRVTKEAGALAPGRMAAVLGLDEAGVAVVCAEAGAELCNINAPGQIVIGGTLEAVERACALALERGAKRAIPLDVSAAFHTSLMAQAADAMREAIVASSLRDPRIAIVANDRAQPLQNAKEIGDELVFQLTHPVRWVQCVEYTVEQGVTKFVEIGPGRVLTGLIKRIAPGVEVRNINAMPARSQ